MILRIALVLLAFLSLFWFSAAVSGVLLVLAALALAPAGILLGVAADLLYYAPGAAWFPWWSFAGILACVASYLVQRVLKTRIMER